ncbi:MAG: tetratricopeptide repeat protein [Paracoccaceae bacterium]
MLNKPSSRDQIPQTEDLQVLVDLFAAGKLKKVLLVIKQMLTQFPNSPVLYNFRGTTQISLREFDLAIDSFKSSIRINPNYAESYNKLGIAFDNLRNYSLAVESFKKAVAINPNYSEAHYNMGNTFLNQSYLGLAINSYRLALEIEPNYADVFNNLGLALRKQGKLTLAIENYEKCIKINPTLAEAHYNMAVALQENNQLIKSLKSYANTVAIRPDNFKAYNNMGTILKKIGDFDKALENFRKALKINPNFDMAYNNMGLTLKEKGDLDDATNCFEKAIKINPKLPIFYYNKALCLGKNGLLPEAILALDEAISVKPDYFDAFYHKAACLRLLGEFGDSLKALNHALIYKPDFFKANDERIYLLKKICDWSELGELITNYKLLGVKTPSVKPWPFLSSEDHPERQLIRASKYALENYNVEPIPLAHKPKSENDKLRIGYFSADFRENAISYQLARVLALHDRSKIEVYAYSFGQADDDMRKRIIDSVDHFKDVTNLSDKDVALLAREDKIDIAIDLMGYTKGCRTNIFAFRAAPIQIYPWGTTMASKFIDYVIADNIVIPDRLRDYYQEKIIYLPNSFMPTNNTKEISDTIMTRKDMGLPEDGFVFCCFNNNYKITPREFDIWMRLLTKVEGSVLWLANCNKWAKGNLQKEAEQRGVDPSRLIVAERLSTEDHLARHRLADLFLDTFNFNAHSTASDALWAGLPVITKIGEQSVARFAASMLSAVGLPELITKTKEQYEDLALNLATNRKFFDSIREKLLINRLKMPLYDSENYTRSLELGYENVFDLYQKCEKARDTWIL